MDQELADIKRQLDADPKNTVLRKQYEAKRSRLNLTGKDAEYLEKYHEILKIKSEKRAQRQLKKLNQEYSDFINPRIKKETVLEKNITSEDANYLQEYLALCERLIGVEMGTDDAKWELEELNKKFKQLSPGIRRDEIFILDAVSGWVPSQVCW